LVNVRIKVYFLSIFLINILTVFLSSADEYRRRRGEMTTSIRSIHPAFMNTLVWRLRFWKEKEISIIFMRD
jgi:hypothetical protein